VKTFHHTTVKKDTRGSVQRLERGPATLVYVYISLIAFLRHENASLIAFLRHENASLCLSEKLGLSDFCVWAE
jgi:hypothetical protein